MTTTYGTTDPHEEYVQHANILKLLHSSIVSHLETCGLEKKILSDVCTVLKGAAELPRLPDTELFVAYRYAFDGLLRLTVSSFSGSNYEVAVLGRTKVLALKCEVEQATGIPVCEQRLMHKEKIMEDASTVAAYDISPFSRSLTVYRQPLSHIYALGGRSEAGHTLDAVEALELPSCSAWAPSLPCLTSRSCSAAAVANGCIYVVGGDDGLGESLSSAEVFEPSTARWRALPPMRTKRSRLALVATRTGHICAIGGTDGTTELASVELFDPNVEEMFGANMEAWTRMPDLPSPRWGLAATAVQGRVYAVGGQAGKIVLRDVECLSEGAHTWQRLPSLRDARKNLSCVALDGRIYVIGGHNGLMALDAAECFDPVACSWQPLARMSTRRSCHGAAAAGNIILVAGGVSRREPLQTTEKTTEIYDAKTGTWHTGPSMGLRREGFAMVSIG